MDDPGGAFIGKYRLIARLGEGGSADVFLAMADSGNGIQKLQVVKRLKSRGDWDSDQLAMFMDEARLCARMNHPHVVQTAEVGEGGASEPYLAMEYIEGQSLYAITRKGGSSQFPLHLHLRVLADVLDGLHYAHELTDFTGQSLGVVHRDVSPHNVLVTYFGVSKVVDFGVAKMSRRSRVTETGALIGKISYMAPEQAMGDREIDRGADLFAVGVMLWEAITGKRFWDDQADTAVLLKLAGEEFHRSAAIDGVDVAPELDAICVRALAPKRRDRFATAAEMRDAIESYLRRVDADSSSRAVAAWLGAAFAEERAKMTDAIKRHIEAVESTSGSTRLFSENLPLLNPGGSTPRVSVRDPSQTTRKRPAKRSGWLMAAGAMGIVAIGATFLFAKKNERPDASAVSATPPVAAPSPPPAPRRIIVSLSASPRDAILYFDDTRTGNPARIERTADTSTHTIRAEAPGYAPQTRTLNGDQDATLELALAPLPSAASTPAKSERRSGARTRQNTQSTQAGLRGFDKRDPWSE